MITLILIGLAAAAVAAGMLARFYTGVPVAELKRRSRGGSREARLIYEIARHEKYATNGVLYGISILSFTAFAVMISRQESFVSAFLIILGVGIVWYAARERPRLIRPLGLWLAPYFSTFILRCRPAALKIRSALAKLLGIKDRTEIYELEDLEEILKKQKTIAGNRIKPGKLDMLLAVLSFEEKLVKDYLTPRKVVRFVRSDEPVSTVLMSELHDSGFSRFPVYMDEVDNIVGTLYLRDLVEHRMSGKVFSAMHSDVVELSDEDSLEKALKQFLQTKHHMAVVKNKFGEVLGILTIEDVIEQVIGRKIVDESDQHEDMREFAEDINRKETDSATV